MVQILRVRINYLFGTGSLTFTYRCSADANYLEILVGIHGRVLFVMLHIWNARDRLAGQISRIDDSVRQTRDRFIRALVYFIKLYIERLMPEGRIIYVCSYVIRLPTFDKR